MHDNICYKKPFLKEVVFQINYSVPLVILEKELSHKVTKEILKHFPISAHRSTLAQEFQFNAKEMHSRQSEAKEWLFYGKLREKSFLVNSQNILYSNTNYETYENLRNDIDNILTTFLEVYKEVIPNRLGLRYINVIDLKEDNALIWNDYVYEKFLGIIDFHDEKEKETLSRVFHILEYNFGDYNIKYQFGIANPDFPAIIRKKQFVLDLDAYAFGITESNDIKNFIDMAHSQIQDLFEKSIKDKTRNLMRLKK